nr:hypothetical protein CFP56_60015 [Quercus suber]
MACNLQDVILEGDCAGLFTALQQTEPRLAIFGTLVEDIKWTASRFIRVIFNFTSSVSNHASHELAKEALLSDSVGI